MNHLIFDCFCLSMNPLGNVADTPACPEIESQGYAKALAGTTTLSVVAITTITFANIYLIKHSYVTGALGI